METPPPLIPIQEPDESARSWCIGLHLSGLSGIILPFALAHVVVPLVIWLIKRADSPAIDATGKEVLNFQISFSIYFALSAVLWIVLIGVPISIAIVITWMICTIIAAVRTSNGEAYRYPMTIRFLK